MDEHGVVLNPCGSWEYGWEISLGQHGDLVECDVLDKVPVGNLSSCHIDTCQGDLCTLS